MQTDFGVSLNMNLTQGVSEWMNPWTFNVSCKMQTSWPVFKGPENWNIQDSNLWKGDRILSPHEAVLSSESRDTCLTTPTASNMQKLKTSIGELHDSTEKQLKSGLQIWPRGFSGPRFHCWDPHHDFLGLIVFSNSSFEGFYILKPSLAPGHLWCEYRRAGTYMHVWIQSSRHIHACVIQSSRHIYAFGYGVKTSEGERRKARKGGLRQREETQVKLSSRS